MDSTESIIGKLNGLLKQQEIDAAKYLELLDMLKANFNIRFILVDLEKYNEERMLEHRQMKLEAASQRNFEHAAWHRSLENDCKDCIDLKNRLDVTNPMFVYEGGLLYFFYFGKFEAEKIMKQVFAGYLETSNDKDGF